MAHINDTYDERHLFDPPTSLIRGPNNTLQVIFLTLCLAGLQFTWTVEMAYGTPYLLSLGLSKSYMSLVWIAGPLSGLVMQPVVGVISDGCRSKWGRRRPFLLGGSIVVVLSLLVIGWTREITWFFTRQEEGEEAFKTVSIIVAITSIYILDFSVNCVQASCRALIVDSLPPSRQEDGTAWAGRMVGLGNVAGYFMGYANLVKVFPFFGNTQLKVLCVFATFVLLGCDAVTCYAVKEKVLDTNRSKSNQSPFALFSDIFRHIWHLPKPIQRICNVQFFAWIGWFPFLFYSTTWVAEIYTASNPDTGIVHDSVGQATRAGSFAFLVYSLVSLSSSFVLPLIVMPSRRHDTEPYTIPWWGGKELRLSCLNSIKLSFLTLPRAWTISQFVFCICMLSTLLVTDVTAAAVVIGLCGISWAISMWAPFSLLGEYISEQESRAFKGGQESAEFNYHVSMMASRTSLVGMVGTEPAIYHPVAIDEEEEEEIEMLEGSTTTQESTDHPPAAGVLLGIHNMYIVLPQFLVTFFSSILFRILESSEESADAIGVILRIGAVMAGIAGFISLRIGRD
ncbi:major facilitator superfamily domain-containing protein [Gilbertella persicaria]|uniref:major facilitator superfamily domain-containing protein n=1 Tax=Gilbertella persicaria TaxID=101096 RepID=UPI00221E7D38|nr:major facilitator superfamily domain-containing protein [Gilbertella persicaria]KAI8064796.1 major facilitator superfamily domain-containing protein [Gilbertella persicaria]